MRRNTPAWIALTGLLSLLLPGCSSVPVSEARLYNINNDMLTTVRLYELHEHYGRINLRLPDGERLRGEYTLTNEQTSRQSMPRRVRISFDNAYPAPQDTGLSALPSLQVPRSLAKAFGYRNDDRARPAAVATAVGDRGTALEIVFYTLNIRDGRGRGIAHDSRGNWYLVHLGL